MDAHSDRLRSIRTLALLLTLLSFLVVLISAYLRLSGAGLGCGNWPDCYGQLLGGVTNSHTGMIRVLHRIVASLSLLLGFVLAWHCLRPEPLQPLAGYATALLVLMIVLALAGLWSHDPRRALTSFINMLGGLGLVSLAWRIFSMAGTRAARPVQSFAPVVLRAGLFALVLTMAMGALIGARFAAASCVSTPSCAGVWWPAAEGWGAINPVFEAVTPAGPGDPGGVALHLLHRYSAVLAVLLLGIAGHRAMQTEAGRPAGRLLLTLLAVEFALGGLTVVSGFSLWLAIGHSVCAAALLAAGFQLLKDTARGGQDMP